jgi:carbamoyltransferase
MLPPDFGPMHRMLFRHDPLLGHAFVPEATVRFSGARGGYFVRTNRQGFRSDWDFQSAKGERPRILFFGDSVTAGDLCENRERFSDLVGEILNVETYNYGLPGSGTDQQLLVLRDRARDVEADVIVLALYVENIERNKMAFRFSLERQSGRAFRMPKPYFALDEGRLTLRNVPISHHWPVENITQGDHRTRTARQGGGVEGAARRLARRMPRIREIASALAESPLGPALSWLRRSWLERLGGSDDLPDYRSADSHGWRLLEAIVREFRAAAGRIPIVLMPIPTYAYLIDGLPVHYQQRFEDLAQSLVDVHVLDLTSPLQRLTRRQRFELLARDLTHFTPDGHRRVAEIIADRLVGLELLPDRRSELRVAPTAPAPSPHVWILGLSCFFHDAGAALIKDGEIVAAALEERFTRVKHDPGYPSRAINYCLEEAGINASQLSAVAYHQSLGLNLERMFTTLLSQDGLASTLAPRVLSHWFEGKLGLTERIRRELSYRGPIFQGGHHRSHAAAAFFASPFPRAAVLTIDGVGEWVSASLGVGNGSTLELLRECRFPQSVGLFYSAVTRFLGFRANTDEYKIMGLAPYGSPRFVKQMREHLIHIHDDGSVELHEVFGIPSYEGMAATLEDVLGVAPRQAHEPLRSEHADVARSLQELLEDVVLRMAAFARRETNETVLCLAGGVALNCAATGRLLRSGIFDDVWIQPAADDSGSSLGVALDLYYTHFGGRRRTDDLRMQQRDSCLGPSYSDLEIRAFLDTYGCPYETLAPSDVPARLADLLVAGKIVGRFGGRGEFGPRALGSRSILADPRDSRMQAEVNRRIKQREGFRPFAPAVLEERASAYFELDRPSPYMSFAVPVVESHRKEVPPVAAADLVRLAPPPASDIPAVTHIDHSARVQTVSAERSPAFHALVSAFDEKSGCPVVLNTSFNVSDEPIVWTPYDAYRCFMRSGLDALSIGNEILLKEGQPPWIDGREGAARAANHRGPSKRSRRLHHILVRALARVSRPFEGEIGRDAGSGWRPAEHGGIPTRLPEWPADKRGAAAFVDELTADWTASWLRDALRPVLIKVVRLASRHSGEAGRPPSVNDDFYVMF